MTPIPQIPLENKTWTAQAIHSGNIISFRRSPLEIREIGVICGENPATLSNNDYFGVLFRISSAHVAGKSRLIRANRSRSWDRPGGMGALIQMTNAR